MADFECPVAIIEKNMGVIQEEMRTGQEQMS
jgi:hypothetical protein